MSINTVDVYIYIPSKENNDVSSSSVIGTVTNVVGVVKARVNQYVNHLLTVEYDPDHVSSQDILSAVKEQESTATLIGM